MKSRGISGVIIADISGINCEISRESGMRKDNDQKIKLLQLHEMLNQESNPDLNRTVRWSS